MDPRQGDLRTAGHLHLRLGLAFVPHDGIYGETVLTLLPHVRGDVLLRVRYGSDTGRLYWNGFAKSRLGDDPQVAQTYPGQVHGAQQRHVAGQVGRNGDVRVRTVHGMVEQAVVVVLLAGEEGGDHRRSVVVTYHQVR